MIRLAGMLFMLLAASLKVSGDTPGQTSTCCTTELEPVSRESQLPAGSIYALPSKWQDTKGKERVLGHYAGRVRILAMFFTHCEYACPRILAELRELEESLGQNDAAGFLLVSFDSQRDTPDSLAAFAREQELAPERWNLLHGSPENVRELSVILDVAYREQAEGNFSHASVIHVLDPQGRIVYQKKGLGGDLEPAKAAIREALKNDNRPTSKSKSKSKS